MASPWNCSMRGCGYDLLETPRQAFSRLHVQMYELMCCIIAPAGGAIRQQYVLHSTQAIQVIQVTQMIQMIQIPLVKCHPCRASEAMPRP